MPAFKRHMISHAAASVLALTALSVSGSALSGCFGPSQNTVSKADMVATESKALNDWFEARYEDELARSPMTQTYLGQKTAQSQLDDVSQIALDEEAALTEQWLKDMRARFDIDRLDTPSKLSYRLYEFGAKDALSSYDFADHQYVFNHMSGAHSDLPSFMINFHTIEDVKDADSYIERLMAFETYFAQLIARAETQVALGVLAPRFVYDKLIPAATNIIKGAPFDTEADSPLLADFKSKLETTDIGPVDKLLARATKALHYHRFDGRRNSRDWPRGSRAYPR